MSNNDPWETNALSRWREFSRSRFLPQEAEADALRFIKQLRADPFGTPAKRDLVGEFYTVVHQGEMWHIGAGFTINTEFRQVDVIGYELIDEI
ncbi:hypothetical protein [Candidatus Poriferisocius sp.]|uniref:hypothetical protein n=1 Tax=Candidatus Poriferisocius sp. TaxID=3101276 RepID=UPI003B0295D8